MRNGYFWCTSNGWTSHHVYSQFLQLLRIL
jgi:hypothetical protein